jgi:hypothetical protein
MQRGPEKTNTKYASTPPDSHIGTLKKVKNLNLYFLCRTQSKVT